MQTRQRTPKDTTVLIPAASGTTADTIAAVSHAVDQAQPLTFRQHLGDNDVYTRPIPGQGPALFVLPGIWAGMPADLLAVVRDRRAADVTGECPSCGACLQLAAGQLAHDRRCRVADEKLRPALARWARQVGPARGRRIVETPGEQP